MCMICAAERPSDPLLPFDLHDAGGMGLGLVRGASGGLTGTIAASGLTGAAAGAEDGQPGPGSPPRAAYTWDQIADQLTDGYWQAVNNQGPRSFDVSADRIITYDFSALNDGERTIALAAMESWAAAAGLTFQAGANADVTFQNNGSGATSTSVFSGDTITRSTVNITTTWAPLHLNGYMLQTYIHELGHALGLGHAGNYNGGAVWGVDNDYDNDSWSASVMSYFDQTENPNDPAGRQVLSTVMPADVIAIQNLYGAATTTHTGDTVWGRNSNMGGFLQTQLNMWTRTITSDNLNWRGQDFAFTIVDSGGTDLIDFSNFAANQQLTLVELGFSDIDGQIDNVAIARGSVIENGSTGAGNDILTGNGARNILTGNAGQDTFFGGAGNDSLFGGTGIDTLNGGADADLLDGGDEVDGLFGNSGDDTLAGGAGADLLDGGTGRDAASYALAATGVQAELQNAALNTGEAAGDTYVLIESLIGSAFGDTLGGNNGITFIDGGAGNDSIRGFGGNDVLNGGAGNDTLVGGAGADRLDGDDGIDFASYTSAGAGVAADLFNVAGFNTGEAAGDTYVEVEGILGTGFADTLGGNNGDNFLFGYGGDDQLFGQGGNDSLTGNSGRDILYGGNGDDTLSGGSSGDAFVYIAGQDVITDFADNVDEIRIDDQILAAGARTVQGVLNLASIVGGSVQITFSPGNVLILNAFGNINALADDIVLI